MAEIKGLLNFNCSKDTIRFAIDEKANLRKKVHCLA